VESLRKFIWRGALILLGWPFAVFFGALLERYFDKRGWLEDPTAFITKASNVFVLIYQSSWFIPAALSSIFFAGGVWLDALLRRLSATEKETEGKRVESEKKRIGDLGRRALNASRAISEHEHRNGISDHVLFAETVALSEALENEGLTLPENAAPGNAKGAKRLMNYFQLVSVYLMRNNMELARGAHELIEEEGQIAKTRDNRI